MIFWWSKRVEQGNCWPESPPISGLVGGFGNGFGMTCQFVNHQSSIINSSIINYQSSSINHQSSIINHGSSIINHPTSERVLKSPKKSKNQNVRKPSETIGNLRKPLETLRKPSESLRNPRKASETFENLQKRVEKTHFWVEMGQILVPGALDRAGWIRWIGGPRKSRFWPIFPKKSLKKQVFSVLPPHGFTGIPVSPRLRGGIPKRASFFPACGVGFLTSSSTKTLGGLWGRFMVYQVTRLGPR